MIASSRRVASREGEDGRHVSKCSVPACRVELVAASASCFHFQRRLPMRDIEWCKLILFGNETLRDSCERPHGATAGDLVLLSLLSLLNSIFYSS